MSKLLFFRRIRPEEAVVLAFGILLFLLRCYAVSCSISLSERTYLIIILFVCMVSMISLLFLFSILLNLVFPSLPYIRLFDIPVFFRDFSPLLLVFLLYETLSVYGGYDLIHMVNPVDRDDVLIALDDALFGVQLSVWSQQFVSVWMTELMNFFYSLHFFLPLVLAVVLYWLKNKVGFRDFMLGVVLTTCIGYVFYFIVPALGPAYNLKYDVELVGGSVEEMVYVTSEYVQSTHRAAFPSLHVALSAVVLLFAFRYSRNAFYLLLVPVLMLWVSTIYLRQHYLVDVVAGWILALVCFYLSPRINRLWYESD